MLFVAHVNVGDQTHLEKKILQVSHTPNSQLKDNPNDWMTTGSIGCIFKFYSVTSKCSRIES